MTTNLLTPVAAQSAAPSVARPRGAGGGQDFASALDAADRAFGTRDVPATPGRADRSRMSDEPARDTVRSRDTGSADGAADPTGTASTDAPPSASDGAPGQDTVQPTPAATSAATTAATPTPTAAATTAVAGAGSPVPADAASGGPAASVDAALPAPVPTSASAPVALAAASDAGTTVAPTPGTAGTEAGAAGTTPLAPSAGTPTGTTTTGTTTDSTTGTTAGTTAGATTATPPGGATGTTPGGTRDGGASDVSAGSSDVLRGPTADGPRAAADVAAVRPDPASVTSTVTAPAGSAGAATGAPAPAASGAATVPTAAPAAGPSPATAPPLAEQLGARLATLGGLQRGTHVLTVPVDPEHLGPVRIVAHIGVESVRVELVGATDASRHALQQSLGDLRRDLAAAGLQVDVGDRRGASDPSADGSRDGSSGPRPGTAGAPDETRGDRAVPTPTTAAPGHAGRLDLVV